MVELIHRAWHYASYDHVRRVDPILAVHNLQNFVDHKNTPILSNVVSDKFCQYAADNSDIIKETLDDMGTFDAIQYVVYQRGRAQHQKKKIYLGKAKSKSVPPEFHQLEHVTPIPFHQNPKLILTLDETMFVPDDKVSD